MPFIYTTSYRVRYHDCDAYGHMSHASYARYMQETAVEASEAVGYGFKRYDELNMRWLIRETHIEYLQPLYHQDTFEVKTWTSGFRRIRSLRHYEFYKGGTLAARARTDWVLIDLSTRQPISAPQEMIEAYNSGEESGHIHAHKRLPAPPPPPSGVFKQRRKVVWSDIDGEQHVNNARYLDYAADIAFEVTDAYGWSLERVRAAGFVIIAREQQIEYKQSALLGDELEIATYVYDMKRISGTRFFSLTRVRDGAQVAQVRSGLVAVDPVTGKPTRIPAQFLEDFAPNIVMNGA
ncbi:MAG: thioesterase family protein [Anaerolineae bacterium]